MTIKKNKPQLRHFKKQRLSICILIVFLTLSKWLAAQSLPPLGLGLAGNEYFLTFNMFSDAMKSSRWINVASWDSNGFPASANAGQLATARIGIAGGAGLDNGLYTLTWEGNGEVVFYDAGNNSFSLVSEDLVSNPKRRVYNVTTTSDGIGVRVLSYPATNIKLWIPGMENHGSLWNPNYLCYMNAFSGGVFRFMDLNGTNNSEQVTWSDRTPRNWSTYVNINQNNSVAYNVVGKVAYEAMIEFSNEMNSDLWICIPHEADDNYIANLAHLIRTGIDLQTGEQTTQPLNPNLRVWLEYSNEVWNFNFAQSSWVNNNIVGANLDVKYATKARSVFEVFRTAFNDDTRVIRVLATQTASLSRTNRRINALTPADWDVLAITTYFRYDYEEYIYNNWNGGTLSHQDFYNHISNQMGSGAFQYPEAPHGHSGTALCYYYAGQAGKQVVSYEGNEHFNAVREVDTNNDGATDTDLYLAVPGALAWLHSFARSNFMYDLLEQYQLRHEASGLQTHIPFVSVRPWSEYGQWGYAESLWQDINLATKYRWLHDHFNLTYPSLNNPACLALLPVEFTNFTATLVENKAQLRWETTVEQNNKGFEIWHSTDKKNWQLLEFEHALDVSSAIQQYEYWHETPTRGDNYYRIKQVDFDDQYTYSPIRSVKLNTKTNMLIYPNPTGGFSQIKYYQQRNDDLKLKVYNGLGQEVLHQRLGYFTTGEHTFDLSTTALKKGIYQVVVYGNYQEQRSTLIVQ